MTQRSAHHKSFHLPRDQVTLFKMINCDDRIQMSPRTFRGYRALNHRQGLVSVRVTQGELSSISQTASPRCSNSIAHYIKVHPNLSSISFKLDLLLVEQSDGTTRLRIYCPTSATPPNNLRT